MKTHLTLKVYSDLQIEDWVHELLKTQGGRCNHRPTTHTSSAVVWSRPTARSPPSGYITVFLLLLSRLVNIGSKPKSAVNRSPFHLTDCKIWMLYGFLHSWNLNLKRREFGRSQNMPTGRQRQAHFAFQPPLS